MANSSELRHHATVRYITVCAIDDFKDLETLRGEGLYHQKMKSLVKC